MNSVNTSEVDKSTLELIIPIVEGVRVLSVFTELVVKLWYLQGLVTLKMKPKSEFDITVGASVVVAVI
jgi:hypothetical protein